MTVKWANPVFLCLFLCATSAALPPAPDTTSEQPPLQLNQLIDDALRYMPAAVSEWKKTETVRKTQIPERSSADTSEAGRRDGNTTGLNLVLQVKETYYGLRHAYAIQDLIDSQRDALHNLLSVARANYSVGKGLQQDILKAEVQLSLMEARRIAAANDVRAREIEMNALLGRASDSPLGRPPDYMPSVYTLSLEDLQRKAAELSALSRHSIAAPEKSDPDKGCNTTSDDERTTKAHDACDNGARILPYRVAFEYAKADSAAKTISLLRTTILPLARVAAHSSLVAYENGTAGFLDVLTNYMTIFESDVNCQDEVEQLSTAEARLEELAGADPGR